ncbi:hypothetical protein ACS0TY_017891 [Phlomoides rotata]
MQNMVVAGTETTSNTVECALAEMMNRSEILKKAQQELKTVVGNESIVEESHMSKLPYLYSVMKEVLRLHSPLSLSVPHSPAPPPTSVVLHLFYKYLISFWKISSWLYS